MGVPYDLSNLNIPAATESGSKGTQPTGPDVEQQLQGLAGLLSDQPDALDMLRGELAGAEEKANRGFLERVKDSPVKAALQALLVGGATAAAGPVGLAAAAGLAMDANEKVRAEEAADVASLQEKVSKAAEARRLTLANLITSGQGAGLLNPDGTFPKGTSAELLGNMLGLGIPFHPGTLLGLRNNTAGLSAMSGFLEGILPHVKSQQGRMAVFQMMNAALPAENQFSPEHLVALAGANETPMTFDQFIEVFPTAEGMNAAMAADLNGLDYSDARILEMAGNPIGKEPTRPASDLFKKAAWDSYQKILTEMGKDPSLALLPASQLAKTVLDEATVQVLRDEIPGFEDDEGDELLETVFASSLQSTLLADAIRKSKDPNAPSIVDVDTLSNLIINSFNKIRSELRTEKALNMSKLFDDRVKAYQAKNPDASDAEARVAVVRELQSK